MASAASAANRSLIREMMHEERRAIRELLHTLTSEQWDAPSLCDEWTVRDVVAHLLAWDDLLLHRTRSEHRRALLRFTILYARSFASMDRLNARLDVDVRDLAPQDLLQRFAVDDGDDLAWLFDGTNPGGHLAEYVIHRFDISDALGLAAEVPEPRLIAALDGVTKLPGVRAHARWLLFRRRWHATDIEWTRGRGRDAYAPGKEILLTLAGRGPLARPS